MSETKHELKTLRQYFQATWCGDKTFEIRQNDRWFKERDEIVLQEWEDGNYTGREIHGFITYLTDCAQRDGWVVFAFRETGRTDV